ERVTGIDLVKAQLLIAEGKPLPWKQEDIHQRGAAIECRIYAEDPDNNFLPSPGKILGLTIPAGPGIRDDGGIYEGYEVPIYYDPLLSKLVAWGSDRGEAVQRIRRALQEYRIVGIKTNLPFLRKILEHKAFIKGEINTHFINHHITAVATEEMPAALREVAIIAAAIHAYDREINRTQQPAHTSKDKTSRWKQAGRQAFLHQNM
ncbi:MAG: acetyl-CoA carboxylase biotin carboxylase subunit, partial [Candidatus Aminicenantes bacterium]|nr:acetyl-CoA carboxylase biotin carboxylase subunit [Candidatus Aminicenantes bacterium]